MAKPLGSKLQPSHESYKTLKCDDVNDGLLRNQLTSAGIRSDLLNRNSVPDLSHGGESQVEPSKNTVKNINVVRLSRVNKPLSAEGNERMKPPNRQDDSELSTVPVKRTASVSVEKLPRTQQPRASNTVEKPSRSQQPRASVSVEKLPRTQPPRASLSQVKLADSSLSACPRTITTNTVPLKSDSSSGAAVTRVVRSNLWDTDDNTRENVGNIVSSTQRRKSSLVSVMKLKRLKSPSKVVDYVGTKILRSSL